MQIIVHNNNILLLKFAGLCILRAASERASYCDGREGLSRTKNGFLKGYRLIPRLETGEKCLCGVNSITKSNILHTLIKSMQSISIAFILLAPV